jgi:hypothetical protein
MLFLPYRPLRDTMVFLTLLLSKLKFLMTIYFAQDSILVDSMNLDKYIWEIVKGTKCDEMRSNAFSLALVILSQRGMRFPKFS